MVAVALRAYSHYSPPRGALSPRELARRGADAGLSAVALTDVETLAGQVEFHAACREVGVRAITGLTLEGARGGRVMLLAEDLRGYANLCRIVTARRARRTPPEPLSLVVLHAEGLFVLSDAPALLSEPPLADLDRKRVFAVFDPSRPDERACALVESARRTGIAVAADPELVSLRPEDLPLVGLMDRIEARRRRRAADPELAARRSAWVPRRSEDAHGEVARALDVAARLASACRFELSSVRPPIPPRVDGAAFEARVRRAGAARFSADADHESRLSAELRCVREMGLEGPLSAAADVVSEARRRGISTWGRGSAAGSLVAFALGITHADPVKEGLHFERFAHPLLDRPPDIDLDVASARRDELLSAVFARFGADRVAGIATRQTFRRKTAYREGLLALGMDPARVDGFVRSIPEDDSEPLPDAEHFGLPEETRRLLERLVGKPHHLSAHPGGLVISAAPLEGILPLERAPKGVLVTQYDRAALERLGVPKLDLLGNRCLDELDELARRGFAFEAAESDAATLSAIGRAETVGCFQLESPLTRLVLRQLPVRSLSDVTAALALVRPAPGSSDERRAFLRRARGGERATRLDPRLDPILASTHGLLLYEEDVMRVIQAVTGDTMAEADRLRDALVRGTVTADDLANLAEQRGFLPDVARRVASDLARFAEYSFSKAHALSYAMLAVRAASARTHEPVAFACAVLNHHGGLYPLRALAADFARSGVRILPPSVEHSVLACTTDRDAVRVGLGLVKHVSRSTKLRVLEARERQGPFRTFDAFRGRVQMTHRELVAWVLSGACDGLSPLVPEEYPFVHRRVLGEPSTSAARTAADDARVRTYSGLVRIRNELRYLEMHLSHHPMSLLRDEARRAGGMESDRLPARGPVAFAGLVSAARRVPTRGGKPMHFLTLEDERGLVDAIVLPGACGQETLTTPGPYLVFGERFEEFGVSVLRVERIVPFFLRERPYAKVTPRAF
jgi:DNA polymerase III alpha subunit